MKFDLTDNTDIESFKDRCKYLIDNGKKVELKEVRKRRSLNQNNYLHLILTWWGLETGYSLDEAKTYFKRHSPDIFVYEKNGMKFLKSSRDVNTKEMTISIERFRNWSGENGILLPAPNEHEFLRHIENEIEKTNNKIYI